MKKLLLSWIVCVVFMGSIVAQSKDVKIPVIGSKAPSFTANSTNGELTFPNDFGKSWKILFSHPQDFTPVCSSELLELAYAQKDFNDLGVKIAVISTDDVATHKMWKASLEELDYKGRGTQKISFPIIDDKSIAISKTYGMIHSAESTKRDIRGVYIIDPNNVVRSINFYPMTVGRNMEEIKRTVLALQTSDKLEVSMPANWKAGDDVLLRHYPYTDQQLADNPAIKDEYYNLGDRIWFMKANYIK